MSSKRPWLFPGAVLLLGLVGVVCTASGRHNATSSSPRPQPRWTSAECTYDRKSGLADCSNKGLTHIPKLPSYITRVHFEGNLLRRIEKKTFKNIEHLNLTELYLDNNTVSKIYRNAFTSFPELEKLSIAYNAVLPNFLKRALQGIGNLTSLRYLCLDRMTLKSVSHDFLEGLNTSEIETLSMSLNYFRTFDHSRLTGMVHLRNLTLRGYSLSNFTPSFDVALALNVLDLGSNQLLFVPPFCVDGQPSYPNLEILHLDYNNIWYINKDHFRCMLHLKELYLVGNNVQLFHRGFLSGMSGLRYFDAAYLCMLGPTPRRFETFSNANVSTIFMRNAQIRYGLDIISKDLFEGCTSLSHLYLGQNFFSRAPESFFEDLLGPLQSLRFLDLSSCGLSFVPAAISKLIHLEKIWLFDNYIVQWHPSTFLRLTALRNISMDQNQITNIREDAFPAEVISNLVALNLSRNPFSCTCDILWFLTWMKTNRTIFMAGNESYTCRSPEGYKDRSLLSLPFTETKCLLPEESAILVIVILSLFIIVLNVAPLLFRYRWHIQSAVFMARYKSLREQARREQRAYQYDAFLIYSELDSRRVRQEFLLRLEKDRNLHLCVHERDFWVGKAITDNIVDCMLASRRVLVLLSNAMAASEWCQFMLSLAQAEVTQSGAAPLVLLLVEEITPNNMTPTLYAVLKTTAYLRYPALPQYRDAFWRDVHHALTYSE